MLRRPLQFQNKISTSLTTTILGSSSVIAAAGGCEQQQKRFYHFRTSSKTVAHRPEPTGQKTARELEEEFRKKKVEAYKQKMHFNVREVFVGMLFVSGLFVFLISVAGAMIPKGNLTS